MLSLNDSVTGKVVQSGWARFGAPVCASIDQLSPPMADISTHVCCHGCYSSTGVHHVGLPTSIILVLSKYLGIGIREIYSSGKSKCVQCSEQSSPSVLELGPDGPPAVVCLFSTPWTD